MNQQVFWEWYFFIIGAVVGSFLNVVIYRVPKGESVVRPGSSCPACGAKIKPYNNIPILSWFVLRGKCAVCGAPFSIRYPMVELLTALLFAACFAKFGMTATSGAYMAFCAALVAVIFIDIDHFIIPDRITLPGIVIGLICAGTFLPVHFTDSIFGCLVGGGIFFILAVLVPGGMGGGDIKLMGMVGAFMGVKAALMTIFLGSLFGSIGGLAGIVAFGKERKTKIPFGPYLSIASIISLFYKEEFIDLYLRLFVR
jgi:leader peptidase (prepilin peptidase)/N-methyltransferase